MHQHHTRRSHATNNRLLHLTAGQLGVDQCPVVSEQRSNHSRGRDLDQHSLRLRSSLVLFSMWPGHARHRNRLRILPSRFVCIARPWSHCNLCAGKFNSVSGQSACADCSTGMFTNDATGYTSCASCPAGVSDCTRFSSTFLTGKFAKTSASTSCQDCAPGTYGLTAGQAECIIVPVGFYTNVSGAVTPTACPSGYFSSGKGSIECQRCGPATFAASAGSSMCADCAPQVRSFLVQCSLQLLLLQTIAPLPGSALCTSCPPSTYSHNGVLCQCEAGDYLAPDKNSFGVCRACPEGAACTQSGLAWGDLLALPGTVSRRHCLGCLTVGRLLARRKRHRRFRAVHSVHVLRWRPGCLCGQSHGSGLRLLPSTHRGRGSVVFLHFRRMQPGTYSPAFSTVCTACPNMSTSIAASCILTIIFVLWYAVNVFCFPHACISALAASCMPCRGCPKYSRFPRYAPWLW